VKRDIAIARVIAPHAVLAGQSAIVRVQIRAMGFAKTVLDAHLECDGQTQTRQITPRGDDEAASLEFPVKLSEAGVHAIHVSVDLQPGETFVENNSLTAFVNVIPQKVRALLAGSGSWDYQYLRDMLARSPWVELEV